MTADECFFICFYKDDGAFTGHEVSNENDFRGMREEDKAEGSTGKDDSSGDLETDSADEENSFRRIFEQYTSSMLGYMEILPIVSGFVPSLSAISRANSVRNFAQSAGVEISSDEGADVYRVPLSRYLDFSNLNSRHDVASLVGKQVPKMMIIGIVSSYEHHFSLVLREIFRRNPGKIDSSQKSYSLKDIFESESIDAFKESILEKEIDSILRESFRDQVSWVENHLPLSEKISDKYKGWGDLVEVFERRNLFAHANGIVNNQYIRKTKEFSSNQKNVVKGKELIAGSKYLNASIESICEFGVKLIQVVWRKMDKNDSDAADSALGDFGYELMSRGRYALAVRVLEFSRSLRGKVSEQRYRMNIINLANSYRLLGDDKTAIDILDSQDWSIATLDFKIAISAIKGDVGQTIKIMEKIAQDEDFSPRNFEEWPVFLKMYDDQDFVNAFERLYGRPFAPVNRRPGGVSEIFDVVKDGGDDLRAAKKRRRSARGSVPLIENKPPRTS